MEVREESEERKMKRGGEKGKKRKRNVGGSSD